MEKNWYNLSVDETAKKLNTSLESGLSNEGIEMARAKYGSNQLKEQKKKSIIIKFLDQFKDFMIIILLLVL